MKISQKCSYALRAILELSKNTNFDPVTMKFISEKQGIPLLFLQMIMRELKQSGFVKSIRGKEGGYILNKKPSEIKMGDIIRFVDGELSLVECIGTGKESPCNSPFSCPFFDVWEEARKKLNDVFDSITFEELADRERTEFNKVIDYSI
jgi:Rrf2 family protein